MTVKDLKKNSSVTDVEICCSLRRVWKITLIGRTSVASNTLREFLTAPLNQGGIKSSNVYYLWSYFHTFHNWIASLVLSDFMCKNFFFVLLKICIYSLWEYFLTINLDASLVRLNVLDRILIVCVDLITFVLFKISITRKGISTRFTIKLHH